MSELTQCNYCSFRQLKRLGYRRATPNERKRLWDKKGEPLARVLVVAQSQPGRSVSCTGNNHEGAFVTKRKSVHGNN